MPLFKKFRQSREKEQQQQEQQEQAESETIASELVRNNDGHEDGSLRILFNNKRSDFTTAATMGEFTSDNNVNNNDNNNNNNENSADQGAMIPKRSTSSSRRFDRSQRSEGNPSNTNNNETTDEADNPYKKKGFLSFLSRPNKKDRDMTGDDESVELPLDDHQYDVNALRVPSMLDRNGNPTREENAGVEDVDKLLDDPYAELEGRQKMTNREALMNDPDYDDEEDSKKRFLMGLVSKTCFLLGAIVFLVLAVHDLQRVHNLGPPSDYESLAFTTQGDLGITLDNNTAVKEDRSIAGTSASDTLVWGTRRGRRRRRRHLQATNWYTQYWSNLPGDIQDAAGLLGYDQDTWDNAASVYTDRLYWHQLTPGQQEAATLVFNYNETTWNDFVGRFLDNLSQTPAPTFADADTTAAPTFAPINDNGNVNENTGGDPKDSFYKNLWWADLPDDVREAAATLGYQEDSWNNDDWVLTHALFWSQLTYQEQFAAETMGYDQASWDARNGGPAASPEGGGGTGEDTSGQEEEGTKEEEDGDTSENSDNSGTNQGGETSGSDGNATATEEETGNKLEVSSLVVNIEGEYPPELRGTKYQVLYICAAICMMLVGILDGFHQKLAFHAVMVLAGMTGILAGGFTMFDNEAAFHVCHSLSSHFFLLQAVLLVYSRLLLTYDNVVRKTLAVGDGLFVFGALINVVLSYLRYDTTTVSMARAATAAAVFWCISGMIYVGITLLFWSKRSKTWKSDKSSNDDLSIAESCNVVPSGDGGLEISYHDSRPTTPGDEQGQC